MTYPHVWQPGQPPPPPLILPGMVRPVRPGERGYEEIRAAGLVNGGLVNDGHAMVNGGIIRAHVAGPTFKDQFVDTNATALESHTPNVGTSWTKVSAGTSATISTSLSPTGFLTWTVTPDTYIYKANPDPVANCYMEFTLYVVNASYAGPLYAYMRGNAGVSYGYTWLVDVGAAAWQVESAGVGILFSGSDIPTAGNSLTYKLTAVGNTITGYVNGVQKGQATDSAHPSAGNAGIYWNPQSQSVRSGYTHFETGAA